MKLAFRQIEPFLKQPDPKARAVLVYGPDQGLVKERSAILGRHVVADLNDPFNVSIMTGEAVLADPARFFDEAAAQSLMGGDRLVLVREASDGFALHLKDYLASPVGGTCVIIEAGDLPPRSALRKIAESAPNAAALPCYVDDEKNLSGLIRETCAHAGYGIAADAVAAMAAAIVGDRGVIRSELTKLIVYMGWPDGYEGLDGPAVPRGQGGTITLGDVQACVGDVRDWTLDRLVYAAADGRMSEADYILGRILRDQTAPVAILRALQSHFWRLSVTLAHMQAGETVEVACKKLNPPLFWKVEADFKRQLAQWNAGSIDRALDLLHKAEAETKMSGAVPDLVTRHALVSLAKVRQAQARRAA